MNSYNYRLVVSVSLYIVGLTLGLCPGAASASSAAYHPSDGTSAPQIVITGETGTATGYVVNVDPSSYRVAFYIFITGLGWYSKPTDAQPFVPINSDDTFSGDIVTGGVDSEASMVTALVVPTSYSPTLANGADSIPADALAASIASATAQIPNPNLRTIEFAGQTWDVKYISAPVGPGPCNFSNSPNNVWVDSAGLHLKITNDGGTWHTAEVLSETSFGLGTYTFTLATPVDNFDPNVVLGLFTWSDNAAYTHSEIDTEFSKWSNAMNPQNAQYVRQPPTSGNILRFSEPAGLQTTTHTFDWEADSIDFASWTGQSEALPSDPSMIIQQWNYTGDVPPPTDEKCHINLWLNNGLPPTDGNDVEVVISNFQFQAPEAAPLAPTANGQTVPVAFNTATSVTLTGSDPNTPAQNLTYAIATQPAHGTLTGAAPNLTYTPAATYTGSDTFTFTATNTSSLTSSPATVTLNVAGPVGAAALLVTNVGDSSAAGSGSLRAAMTYANANLGSTVTFQSGLSGTISLTGVLPQITSSMTIQGPGPSALAIDGAGQFRPFTVNSTGAVTLSGLTIQNGSDQADGLGGAGILADAGTSLSITNCAISHNAATGPGGGIANHGTASITTCSVTNNSSSGSHGGGIDSDSALTLTDSSVSGNTASGDGGGVFVNGTASVTGSTLTANTADYGGGGIAGEANDPGTTVVTLIYCTINGNGAGPGSGGGALNWAGYTSGASSTMTLTNCTLVDNTTTAYGGGVENKVGKSSGSSGICTVSLTNCTLTGNTADVGGGGVASAGTTTVTNCISYGDTGGELDGVDTATYSDIQGGHTGVANIDQDPLFAAAGLADNGGATQTIALQSGSPCFGAGTSTGAPATDQRGIARPTPPSIGAYDVTSGGGTPTAAHTFAPGLTMFSVPTDYNDLSPATVLGYDATLAVWDPSADQYDVTPTPPADSLVAGPAYWVRFPAAETITSLGTSPPPTVPFTIGLKSGWNMIGCPQTTPITISTVSVIDSSNATRTFAGAVSNGLVSGTLYTFQPGDTAYEVVPSATAALQPYYGYWLYAAQPCTLSFPALAPPAPPVPAISFTVPDGANSVSGTVSGVDPSKYGVVVYISVPNQGWWIKPYADSPVSGIGANGNWSCDIVTGGNDNTATEIAAFLIPLSYSPPIIEGGGTPNLGTNAVASLFVARQP